MAASESDEQVEPAAGEGSSAASAAALEARAEAGGGKEEGDDKQEGGGADIENVELGLSNSRAASVYRAIKKRCCNLSYIRSAAWLTTARP